MAKGVTKDAPGSAGRPLSFLQRWWPPVKKFGITNFLPLAFAVAVIWSMSWPTPGRKLVRIKVLDDVHIVQEINIFIVFLISGLALKTEDLRAALGYKVGVIYGFVGVLLITPCLGFALRELPLTPRDFTTGLTLFSAVPTTLGVGVALVRSCGGNEGLALLLTIGTNLLGIATMPFEMKLLLEGARDINLKIDILDLFVKLTITIFVPSVIGKVLRDWVPPIKRFMTTHKTEMSLFSTFNLAMIVWQTLSGAQHILVNERFTNILIVILAAILQHVVYLVFNLIVAGYIIRMPLLEAIAVVIMASQKSAPVAVTVISYITPNAAQQGLMAIPAVTGQVSQIFIGSTIAKVISPKVKAYKKRLELEKAAAASAAAGLAESAELEHKTALQPAVPRAMPDVPAPAAAGDVEQGGPTGGAARQQ